MLLLISGGVGRLGLEYTPATASGDVLRSEGRRAPNVVPSSPSDPVRCPGNFSS